LLEWGGGERGRRGERDDREKGQGATAKKKKKKTKDGSEDGEWGIAEWLLDSEGLQKLPRARREEDGLLPALLTRDAERKENSGIKALW